MDERIDVNVVDTLSNASVDWSPLGEGFVKYYEIYGDLDWEVDFFKQKAAVAPYGGPVAVMCNVGGARAGIAIYLQNGVRKGTIQLEGGKVMGIGWTASQNLIVVFDDGTINVYTFTGEKIFSKLLAREIRDQRIAECKFFHTMEGYAGFAVMTLTFQFFIVADSDRDKDSIRVKALAELSTNVRPSCWAVLPTGNNVGIVAAIEDKLYYLQTFETVPVMVACKKDPPPHWTSMAISLNGKAAVLVDKNGYIWAGSSDFKTPETEFDTQSSAKVHQIEWACTDFMVLLLDKMIFLKGLGKHWCKLPVTGPTILLPEIDGIRVISQTACEFLHKVSSATLAVLKVASLKPGAILNDAYKEYLGDESHKADEYIRYIKDKLPEAVEQCIHAASEEFTPNIQQALLMSANFGKGFLGPDVPQEVIENFFTTSRHLRVLNTIRHQAVGIPITYRQFRRLSPGVVIDRLISHGLYPLALEICNYLKIPPNAGEVKVLKQWALGKVQNKSIPDHEVAKAIFNRMHTSGAIVSFAELARVAKQVGRQALASQLLDHEVLVGDQVQLLLEMNETDKALDKAIGSWDAQLVYDVLDKMEGSLRTDEYMQIFSRKPVAAALYKKHLKETNPEALTNIYRQESDFLGAGIHLMAQSYRKPPDDRGRIIPNQTLLKEAQKEFIDGQLIFHIKAVDDQEKLLADQEMLKRDIGFDTIGCTLFDTVRECVRRSQFKAADNLKKRYNMTDNLFWWAKLRGLSDSANYEELERFSKQKKSPIGYEPFAEMCIHRSRYQEALKYIPRCASRNKSALYMDAGDWHKAAEAAFAEKDVASLDRILSRQGRNIKPELADLIRQMKGRLGAA